MEQYLLTNYTHCTQQLTYLESPEFLFNGVHIFSILTFPLSVYGVYLILRVTPKRLEGTKYILLHSQFCIFLLDFLMNVLVTPYLFLPLASVYFMGVLKNTFIPFKIVTFIGQFSVHAFGISLVSIFQSRHSVIVTIKYRITKKSTFIIYYALLYICGFLVILSYHLGDVDIELRKLEFLSKYPCPHILFFNSNTHLITDQLYLTGFGMLSLVIIIVISGFYFFLTSTYCLVFKSAAVSERTKQLQLSFLISASIQVVIPVLALLIPLFYLCYSVIQSVYSQIANNFLLLAISFHGLSSNLALIVTHKPYREYTFRRCEKRKSSKVVSIVI
ncbi:unnamed protein product [Caenorhabditis angaria]|uniref:Serpentine Receptor, class H n=1 Tax=Caenorhabditis angaria TaxID=860376 RepID=A0A9P1IUY0_9PELO|nr:unnamed protein product [Caenorhabditis angaria]